MFYFTCDRSITVLGTNEYVEQDRNTVHPSHYMHGAGIKKPMSFEQRFRIRGSDGTTSPGPLKFVKQETRTSFWCIGRKGIVI